MARTVADRNLGTREARRRLAARRKPYWRAIERGLHVGYYKGSRGGRWIARRYCGEGRYQETVVGTADDVLDADGRAILDFDQAQAGAREWFHAEARRAAGEAPEDDRPFTIGEALDAYLAWYAQHRKALGATRSAIEAHIRPRSARSRPLSFDRPRSRNGSRTWPISRPASGAPAALRHDTVTQRPPPRPPESPAKHRQPRPDDPQGRAESHLGASAYKSGKGSRSV
jgi:hypothetical protein